MELSKNDFKQLKKQYTKAESKGLDSFTFNGHKMLTSYAKYLIEYLDSKMDELGDDELMTGETYDNLPQSQLDMIDEGLDIVNFIKEKEKVYDKEGFGVVSLLMFLPFEIEDTKDGNELAASPGSIFCSISNEQEEDMLIDAMLNFFTSDERKYRLFQQLNTKIIEKFKEWKNKAMSEQTNK